MLAIKRLSRGLLQAHLNFLCDDPPHSVSFSARPPQCLDPIEELLCQGNMLSFETSDAQTILQLFEGWVEQLVIEGLIYASFHSHIAERTNVRLDTKD